MKEPIFLSGTFTSDIWGGSKLNAMFGYESPYSTTGSYWAVSAHPNGDSEVINGKLKGLKLSEVWNTYPELFNYPKEPAFPYLVKIIDAKKDLSIQVHPDNDYALKNEGELGKTECWYVLDAEEDAEVVFGHNAKNKEHFIKLIQQNDWDKLLNKRKVSPGDFIHVPSGMIHSIGAGIVLIEVQQSSDITYRLYDFDRKDKAGNKRKLHLKDAINVIEYKDTEINKRKIIYEDNNFSKEILLEDSLFNVQKWTIKEKMKTNNEEDYMIVSTIDGSGVIIVEDKNYYFNKGDHFLVTNNIDTYEIKGKCDLIITTPTNT